MDAMISSNCKFGSHSWMTFCVMPCTMPADHGAEGSSSCTVCTGSRSGIDEFARTVGHALRRHRTNIWGLAAELQDDANIP